MYQLVHLCPSLLARKLFTPTRSASLIGGGCKNSNQPSDVLTGSSSLPYKTSTVTCRHEQYAFFFSFLFSFTTLQTETLSDGIFRGFTSHIPGHQPSPPFPLSPAVLWHSGKANTGKLMFMKLSLQIDAVTNATC